MNSTSHTPRLSVVAYTTGDGVHVSTLARVGLGLVPGVVETNGRRASGREMKKIRADNRRIDKLALLHRR